MKKKILYVFLLLFFIASSYLLVNYIKNNTFYFDFTMFIIDEKEKEVINIKGLDLNNDVVTKEDIEIMNIKIKERCDYFTSNREFSLDEKSSDTYYAVEDIFYDEFTEFQSANLISVKKEIDKLTAVVEIVLIDDEILFDTTFIEFEFDKDFNIVNEKIISDKSSKTNTTNKLDENSLIEEDGDFLTSLNFLLSEIENTSLYDSIILGEDNSDFIMDNLINSINIESECLEEFFLAGKGDFNDYEIVSYEINDYDKKAITTYTIGFVVDEEVKYFNIEYSRLNKDIIRIFH